MLESDLQITYETVKTGNGEHWESLVRSDDPFRVMMNSRLPMKQIRFHALEPKDGIGDPKNELSAVELFVSINFTRCHCSTIKVSIAP